MRGLKRCVDYLQTLKPKTLQAFYRSQVTEYLNSF